MSAIDRTETVETSVNAASTSSEPKPSVTANKALKNADKEDTCSPWATGGGGGGDPCDRGRTTSGGTTTTDGGGGTTAATSTKPAAAAALTGAALTATSSLAILAGTDRPIAPPPLPP